MQQRFGIIALLAISASLSACASTQTGVEVTRFHLGQEISRGAIRIDPSDPTLNGSLETRQYAEIIGQEMAKAGFQAVTGNDAPQVALFAVSRVKRDAGPAHSPFSIGIGGGTGGGGIGVGVGTTIPIGKPKARQIVLTELYVRIRRQADSQVMWEGRATTEAVDTTAAADPRTAVTRLATALFTDFPGESGKTIRVK